MTLWKKNIQIFKDNSMFEWLPVKQDVWKWAKTWKNTQDAFEMKWETKQGRMDGDGETGKTEWHKGIEVFFDSHRWKIFSCKRQHVILNSTAPFLCFALWLLLLLPPQLWRKLYRDLTASWDGTLWERLTQKIIYGLSSHVTPTGKNVWGFARKVQTLICCSRGTRGRKQWRSGQLTKPDLKADILKQSQPLYFGVIITHCGQVTMLLVHMIDSRISNSTVNQAGSLASALQTTGLPCSLRDPQTHTHADTQTHGVTHTLNFPIKSWMHTFPNGLKEINGCTYQNMNMHKRFKHINKCKHTHSTAEGTLYPRDGEWWQAVSLMLLLSKAPWAWACSSVVERTGTGSPTVLDELHMRSAGW